MHFDTQTKEQRVMLRGFSIRFVCLSILASALAPARTVAQSPVGSGGPGVIEGTVRSSASGQSIASAAITIKSAKDSAIVAGALTTRDGTFRVSGLAPGQYSIRASYLGLEPAVVSATITVAAPVFRTGVLNLETAAVSIGTVEVNVQQSAVVMEADRTVYTAKALPVTGPSAIDLLRAVPELEVDVEDKISLRGNQGVAVQINGRPSPMSGEALSNFLKQFPSDRIAKVEVVPNPSAKNDPEGMGGIVNIILKDGVDLGLSGSVTVSASTRGVITTSPRANYQQGRFTLFAGASVNRFRGNNDSYDYRENLFAKPVSIFERNTHMNFNNGGQGGDLTAEWRLSKKSTLYSYTYANWSGGESDGLSNWRILDSGLSPLSQYDRESRSDQSMYSINAGLGYRYVIQPQRHELSIDGVRSTNDRTRNTSDLRTFFDTDNGDPLGTPDLTSGIDTEGADLSSLQADYVRPWGAKGRINAGTIMRRRTQDNNFARNVTMVGKPDVLDESNAGYGYNETFESAYVTANRTLGKFAVQLGLRAELAQTDFKVPSADITNENDYNSLFPSANFSYSLSPARTVRLSYSRRITRPPANMLNPINPSTDPLNRFIGNPDLSPSYTNSFSLDLSSVGSLGTVRLSPFFHSTTDAWEQIRSVDTLGVSTATFANTTSIKALGTALTFSLKPSSKLSGSASFNALRESRNADDIAVRYSRSQTLWSTNTFFGYKVAPSTTVTGNASYMPARSMLQGRIGAMVQSSLGIRRDLAGGKASANLFVADPFDVHRMKFTATDPAFSQQTKTNTRMRQATFSLTYNFGKPPEQKSKPQEIEAPAAAPAGGGGSL